MNDIDHFRFWKRMKEGFQVWLISFPLTLFTRGIEKLKQTPWGAYKREVGIVGSICSTICFVLVAAIPFSGDVKIIKVIIVIALASAWIAFITMLFNPD